MPQTSWPHAPTHKLADGGTYFVTASTYGKAHHFQGADRLVVLQRGLLSLHAQFGWRLEAWAIFSNHYHFIAHTPQETSDATTLTAMLRELHSKMARWANCLDKTPGRRVWYNYRETRLSFQQSYLARLNYVHQNAVRHGLVIVANAYPWCSAAWFERAATPAQVKTIYRFKSDQVRVADDFVPSTDW